MDVIRKEDELIHSKIHQCRVDISIPDKRSGKVNKSVQGGLH
jgi:hypothetical protein